MPLWVKLPEARAPRAGIIPQTSDVLVLTLAVPRDILEFPRQCVQCTSVEPDPLNLSARTRTSTQS